MMNDQMAFPIYCGPEDLGNTGGMTLRDYFAAKAMQALIASRNVDYENGFYDEDRVAETAYTMATAMMVEREATRTDDTLGILKALVTDLDNTSFSSWQTTAGFDTSLEAARLHIAELEQPK